MEDYKKGGVNYDWSGGNNIKGITEFVSDGHHLTFED
jgi:hypothetical protein